MNNHIKDTLIQMLSPERLARIDSVLDHRTSSLTILLDRIHHPHNIAAVLRSADAFGIKSVHMVEATATNNHGLSEAQKSPGISMGSEKWVQLLRHQSGLDAIQKLKKEGFTIVVFAPPPINTVSSTKNNSMCVTDIPFEQKLCLVFGSELEGIDPELAKEADICAHIPMFGFVESFNISVACAITLFCSVIGKTHVARRTSILSDEEREELRTEWIRKSVTRSQEVIQNLEKRIALEDQ